MTAPPVAPNRESTVDTYSGADIILHCTSDGEPTPQFRWIKDGTLLSNGQKFSLQGNRLIIRNVLQSDQGSYECYAENTVGFDRNTVLLQVHGKLVKITKGSYHSIILNLSLWYILLFKTYCMCLFIKILYTHLTFISPGHNSGKFLSSHNIRLTSAIYFSINELIQHLIFLTSSNFD